MRWALLLPLLVVGMAQGGIHFSGEQANELPAQWRGYLMDYRVARAIGTPPGPGVAEHPFRAQYELKLKDLLEAGKKRELTADNWADIGGLQLRLGRINDASNTLSRAQRNFPKHYQLASNYGSALLLLDDYKGAIPVLELAVNLAPATWKPYEEALLKLARLRAAGNPRATELDDLFGVPYTGKDNQLEPGRIAAEQMKKLPGNAVAVVQQLALWLPSDARLLWQLGELANARGDVRTAAAILDGCIIELKWNNASLRERRRLYRAKADEIAQQPDADHEKFRGDIVFKSSRAYQRQYDTAALGPIRDDAINIMPWTVVSETQIQKPFKPKFLEYLQKLDGKQVTITGYMQAISADAEVPGFMLLEYPVGCWFCEVPDPSSIIYVEMPEGKSAALKKTRVKITGKLSLNKNDPEEFLYKILNAEIGEQD